MTQLLAQFSVQVRSLVPNASVVQWRGSNKGAGAPCAETRRPDGETVPRRMPELVISGDPYDICRLFHGFWRNGNDEDVAGVEGLIDWQVAAGKAAAWNAAGVQVTANVAATGRTTAGNAEAAPEVVAVVSPTSTEKAAAVHTAAAMPAVGTKRRVPSIPALLTTNASSEVGPGGTEVAKKVAGRQG